jgi:hypothetical protein
MFCQRLDQLLFGHKCCRVHLHGKLLYDSEK